MESGILGLMILRYLKMWLVSFSVFIVVDLLWLTVIAQPLYEHYIGSYLAEEPNLMAAGIFYSLFIFGLMYFAILPGLQQKSAKLVSINGALFGFFTYMTYELTNYAVIEGWPFGIVPIDIVWGTFLGLLTSWLSYKTIRKMKI